MSVIKKNFSYTRKLHTNLFVLLVVNMIMCNCVLAQDITITSQGSTRSSAYAMQNKIVTVTRNEKLYTYFGFLEEVPQSTILHNVKILEYEHSTDIKRYIQVGQTEELPKGDGTTREPHGTPSLTLDLDGFLHIVYGPHYAEVKYRKSTQSLYNQPLNLTPETVVPELKSSHDEWTYPIIKTDDSKTLHIAGSLDATNENDNQAEDVGYVRKKINDISWTYPLGSSDPVHLFSPNHTVVRYDVMMNIDDTGKIHILAPDTTGDIDEPKWLLDYYYYTSTNGGNSFNSHGLVWEHDLLKSRGKGNIALDKNNYPHFTMQAGNVEIDEYIYHNYYDGQSWTKDRIELQGKYLHETKLRIDDFGSLFMSFYATGITGWTAPNPILYLGYKNLNDPNATVQKFSYRAVSGHLIWMPTIEEYERNANLDKNWFHMMWQENESGLHSPVQKVYADLIVPNDFEIPLRTFKRYADFRAGSLLSTSADYNSSQPTQGTIFNSTSVANLISGEKIVLRHGFSAKKGSYLSAKIDVTLQGFDVQTNLSSKTHQPYEGENNVVVETNLESESENVLLYPNPSEGIFYINLPKNLISKETLIRMFDSTGRVVHEQSVNGDQDTIKTSSFVSGTYYLVVTNKDQKITKQILISN